MIQKMASPNHHIIVNTSILAQATTRRQVTSEFSDDLFVQLHHRKALPLRPYPQMCGRTQVCLRGPHTVTFCTKRLGEIVHEPTGWFGTESVQGVVSFEITFQHGSSSGEESKASSPQKDCHSYAESSTQRDMNAIRTSRCLLEMERNSRHITFPGTSDRLWAMAHKRSFCPLPCSTRKTMRWLSIAGSVRATASEMRKPAA